MLESLLKNSLVNLSNNGHIETMKLQLALPYYFFNLQDMSL